MLLKFFRNTLTGSFLIIFCLAVFLLIFRIPTVIFAIYIVFALFATYRLKDKWFLVFLLLGAFIIRFIYINIVHTPPESDFKLMYDAAVLLSKGDYSFSQSRYFMDWGYQTGFVAYQGTVIQLFGEAHAIYILKTLNCLWNTGLTLLIYLIAKNHFKEKSARLASVLYMGLTFSITFVSVLSNQHISIFLIVLGIFFLIDTRILRMKPLFRSLLAGTFIALGNIMRPEGLIIITSLMVYFAILFIRSNNKQRLKVVISAAGLFVIYIALNLLFSHIIIDKGINASGLKNNNFYWKFVTGLNYESKGTYNDQDVNLVLSSQMTKDERENLEIKLIRERLSIGPLKLGNLFVNKIQELWCDNPMVWSYNYILRSENPVHLLGNPVKFSDIDAVLQDVQELFTLTVLVLCLIGVLKRRKSFDDAVFIYIAILVISFFLYLFIEVQPRYVYLQEIFLFILGGAGLDVLSDKFNKSGMKSALKSLAGNMKNEDTFFG